MDNLYHVLIAQQVSKVAEPMQVILGVGVDVVPPLPTNRYIAFAQSNNYKGVSHGAFQHFASELLSTHFEKARRQIKRPVMLGSVTKMNEVPRLMPSYNFSNFPFSFVANPFQSGGYHVIRELTGPEKEDFFRWNLDTENIWGLANERLAEEDVSRTLTLTKLLSPQVTYSRFFPKEEYSNVNEVKFKSREELEE